MIPYETCPYIIPEENTHHTKQIIIGSQECLDCPNYLSTEDFWVACEIEMVHHETEKLERKKITELNRKNQTIIGFAELIKAYGFEDQPKDFKEKKWINNCPDCNSSLAPDTYHPHPYHICLIDNTIDCLSDGIPSNCPNKGKVKILIWNNK